MPLPESVRPEGFKALIPQGSGSVCTALKNAVLRLPVLVYQLVKYIWNDDGTITQEFRDDIGIVPTGDGTGSTTLPAPSGISATDGTSDLKITVTWAAVTLASSYLIFRSEDDDPATAVQAGQISGTTFEDFVDGTNVLINVHYNYWVKATNGTQTSGFSSSDSGYASNTAGPAGEKFVIRKNTAGKPGGYVNWTSPVTNAAGKIRAWGAGGGGGGGSGGAFAPGGTVFYSGGGGGGGGYREITVSLEANAVYRIYVGKGGDGGGAPSNDGKNGTRTMVQRVSTGSEIVKVGGGKGGDGGYDSHGDGGAGGAGNGGDDGDPGLDGGAGGDGGAPGTGADPPIEDQGNGGDGGGGGESGDPGQDGRIEIEY